MHASVVTTQPLAWQVAASAPAPDLQVPLQLVPSGTLFVGQEKRPLGLVGLPEQVGDGPATHAAVALTTVQYLLLWQTEGVLAVKPVLQLA